MKFIYIGILLLVSLVVEAQTTAIPDAAFEQKLVLLGIDSDGLVNGQMLTADAQNITKLDVAGTVSTPYTIQDLTGIAAFVNLDTLYCQYNQLTSLDLSNNTNLEILKANDNQITTLNISTNTGLYFLHCYRNNLTNLNISNNTALTHLECYSNPLGTLDLTAQSSLRVLDCTSNQLNSLDISNNTQLNTVYCGVNNLEVLDVSKNTLLSYLDCRSNELSTIDLYQNPSLYSLDCSDNQLTSLDVSNKAFFSWFSCANNQLGNINLLGSGGLNQFNSTNNPTYLYICVEDAVAANGNALWQKPLGANYTQNCFPRAVVGQVTMDGNNNCQTDSLERGLVGSILSFSNGNTVFYETTMDSLGRFVASLDTGSYDVMVTPPSPYWTVCPSTQQITVDASYNLITLNWSLQPTISCPMLQVDIAAPFLRMTGGGSAYTVSYCNNGTAPVQNAMVSVVIDAKLNVLNTNLPIASQNGQIYSFNVGDLGVGQCSDFRMQVLVDTSAIFEQTHCATAHIYPDSICVQGLWNGAVFSAEATCQNDSLFFKVSNTSTIAGVQTFSIFEDDIMMRTGGVNLGGGQDTTIIHIAAPRSTYRISVQQGFGFPALLGDSVATAVIEGCNPSPDGTFNTGFVTQFSNGNRSPFEAVDCQKNIGSFDPNDKSAQPEGYDAMFHYIEENTDLDYKVRFQNTGTDTAFNIVILDTISPYLDITSIKMGASSHTYTWSLEENVLRVAFYNIMLADSNVNEPASHGFFRYRISQQANNSIGSTIYNSAAIYFDYNPPIITNTSWHTVGNSFVLITVNVDEINNSTTKIKVYPNPFEQECTLKIEGKAYAKMELLVYDVMGKLVQKERIQYQNQIKIKRQNLTQGIYFYTLKGDGRIVGTGKVMVR